MASNPADWGKQPVTVTAAPGDRRRTVRTRLPRLAVGDVGDRARIDNVGVGLADAVDDVVAGTAQTARDLFGVGEVELAAERENRGEGTCGHLRMVWRRRRW